MKLTSIFAKVAGGIFSTATILAALFFAGVGIAALITKQDYTAVLNTVWNWVVGLGK